MLPTIDEKALMLAQRSAPFSRPGWLFSLKYDGFRILVRKDGQQIRLITRNGKDATGWYPSIVRSLAGVSGSFIADAEVCAVDQHGRPNFVAISPKPNGVADGYFPALFAFDLLYWKKDLRSTPLVDRLERLNRLLGSPRPHLLVVSHVENNGLELFDEVVRQRLEGVMAKRADSIYVAGRSRVWLKFKRAGHHDGWTRSG